MVCFGILKNLRSELFGNLFNATFPKLFGHRIPFSFTVMCHLTVGYILRNASLGGDSVIVRMS